MAKPKSSSAFSVKLTFGKRKKGKAQKTRKKKAPGKSVYRGQGR
jgi:hypothetical protein